MPRCTFALVIAILASLGAAVRGQEAPIDLPAPEQPTEIGLTIYSNADPASFDPQRFISQQRHGYNPNYAWQVPGFGVVRDTRNIELIPGVNLVQFTGVAEFIDPTTVTFTDLQADPDDAEGEDVVRVIEQNFQFDLVSPQKLLDKYVDQQVTVHLNLGDGQREAVTGTLLSNTQSQLVLQTDDGIRLLGWPNDIRLGELPEGLITRPTLQWRLLSPDAGRRRVRTSYQTDGITWRSDYYLLLNENDTQADLGAWVTILNLSGTRYPDANLKLIAGDVQRIQPQDQRLAHRQASAAYDLAERKVGFEEKSFFEYHLYTLPRPATIEQNSTQQIALFPTKRGIDVEKVLVYYGLPDQARYWVFPNPQMDRNLGQQSSKKVDVYIRFANREDNNLGIPLPKGKVRVYKTDPAPGSAPGSAPGNAPADADDARDHATLEFVGEDLIDHTAKNEKVLIKIGQAFDVTGERVQTDFNLNNDENWLTETIRITLRNAKDQPQRVIIRENLYRWVNWEISKSSAEWEKIDSRTVHFPVTVPAEGEVTVTYTVRYSW